MKKEFENFIKHLEIRNYSPESIRKYAHCLKLFLGYLESRGISNLRKVGREELRAYADTLAHNPKYGACHVGANIRAIKCFFKFLKKTGVVLYDFSLVLREPKTRNRLPKEPLTEKEVTALLEAPDLRGEIGFRDRAILEVFYSTGIRVSEMAHLTLFDLDLANGLLWVREGKGGKDRVVPLGKHACFFLVAYLERVRPQLAKKHKPVHQTRVWLTKAGNPLGPVELNCMVRKYRKKAGIEKEVTPHSFRRTVAVELIRNGCDFLAVKELLGHVKSETTLRYCALSGVDLKEAMKKCHPRFEANEEVKAFEGQTEAI